MMLKNCYYTHGDLYSFNNDNPWIIQDSHYCDINSQLKCNFPCKNLCIYNDYDAKQKSCKELDFQALRKQNCETLFMCNGTSTSFQYIPNALSICQQCEPKSSQVNAHVTSSMVTTSTQFPTSSSSDLYNPTSSLEIIQTTSSASLSDTKHDLTSSLVQPTTSSESLSDTKYDLTSSIAVPTATLDSTKVDLTSSLVQTNKTTTTSDTSISKFITSDTSISKFIDATSTIIIPEATKKLSLPQLQKNKEAKSNDNILIPVLSVTCSLFAVLITALILFKYCCKKTASIGNSVITE